MMHGWAHSIRWSVPVGVVACLWTVFIVITLCLPEQGPVTVENMNYR